jgi:hypothetical protein
MAPGQQLTIAAHAMECKGGDTQTLKPAAREGPSSARDVRRQMDRGGRPVSALCTASIFLEMRAAGNGLARERVRE